MNQLKTEAKTENLEAVNDFLAENLIGCPMRVLMQTELAVEEIFVNIAIMPIRMKQEKSMFYVNWIKKKICLP